MENINTLSRMARNLHWIVAISFISMLFVGVYMTYFEAWPFYWPHKSMGVLLFFIILARVVYRLVKGWPKAVGRFNAIEQKLSKIVHWCLLIGTIALPISGMIHSGASGHGFGFFWFDIVANNPNSTGDDVIAYSEGWALFGQLVHRYMGFAMFALIFLHIAGAIKHHVIYKDATLLRMLGRQRH